MKIEFIKEHLSIRKFNSIEVPPLTVLTGLNGSGKSHLLEAIQNGSVAIAGVEKKDVVFFNSNTFFLDAEAELNEAGVIAERGSLWTHFAAKGLEEKSQRERRLGANANKIVEIGAACNKSIYSLTEEDFKAQGSRDLFPNYQVYLNRITPIWAEWQGSYGQDVIGNVLNKVNKWVNDITQKDIEDSFVPMSFKNFLLNNRLGMVFVNYYDRWRENRENDFYNKEDGKNYPVLTQEQFIARDGEPPWEIINRILSKFSSLTYTVNFPERLERKTGFKLKLISSLQPGVEVGFENLSSGEKTMMALVSCMYKSQTDSSFPKVLLLDEIDSSLHPSMTQNLFDVIDGIFVKEKGMKVLMVTHSPSTVAMAPAGSIHLMQKFGEDRIVKTEKEDALHILTEGFASFSYKESSLKVSYNIKKTTLPVILTEGITDSLILEEAWRKLYGSTPTFEIQDCFDASFLRNLLSRGEIYTKYPHRTFIAVFDFDQEGFESWNNLKDFSVVENDPSKGLLKKHSSHHTYAMLLPVPTNDIAKQVIRDGQDTFKNKAHMPIELLFYGVPQLNDSFYVEQQPGGGTLIKFKGDKVKFAETIVPEIRKESFSKFLPLFAALNKMLGS